MARYSENAWKKEYFLVTPQELAEIVDGLHAVITNTGVHADYEESSVSEYVEKYAALYRALSAGQQLVFERDWDLLRLDMGFTQFLQNCTYQKTNRRSVPDFAEPCVDLGPFPLYRFEKSGRFALDKGVWVGQFPQYTVGLELRMPRKITYFGGDQEKMMESFADFATWNLMLGRIKSKTKLLKVLMDGRTVNTRIRVSEAAKKDLRNFAAIIGQQLEIL